MLSLFFVEDIESPTLIGENAHHIERVLRMSPGEELLISDGAGKWARCQIAKTSKKEINLNILESGVEEKDAMQVSVLQALPKSDRAKETVELLTAAGVKDIYPWQASRSIGRESDKWQVTAIEASKQSRRFNIPKVFEKLDTKSALELFGNFEQVLICHESATSKISEVVKPAKSTLIIIGPEGGLTDEEISQFQSAGGKLIKLGRPVLRSAHAGIAAISAVSALMKVW